MQPEMMIMVVIQLMLSAAGASAARQERGLPTGVTKKHGKYQVRIRAQRKLHYFGTYESVSEAEEKYKAALAARGEGRFPEFCHQHKNQKILRRLPTGESESEVELQISRGYVDNL